MKKVVLFLFLSGLFLANTLAQEAVVPGGGYHQNNGLAISWTLGELAIETLISGDKILTQGFQQPGLLIVSVKDPGDSGPEIIAYPNPTSGQLYVRTTIDPFHYLSHQIYDSTGRLVGSGQIKSSLHEISFHAHEPGLYFVKIFRDNQPVKTFKILKSP